MFSCRMDWGFQEGVFASALREYYRNERRDGLPFLADYRFANVESGKTNAVTLDIADENIMNASFMAWGDGVWQYHGHRVIGATLNTEPDQDYVKTVVAPHYAEARFFAKPTVYHIHARITDKNVIYRRLLLPVRKTKTSIDADALILFSQMHLRTDRPLPSGHRDEPGHRVLIRDAYQRAAYARGAQSKREKTSWAAASA